LRARTGPGDDAAIASPPPLASEHIDPLVRRWMPLAVPLFAVLVCAMALLIWHTVL